MHKTVFDLCINLLYQFYPISNYHFAQVSIQPIPPLLFFSSHICINIWACFRIRLQMLKFYSGILQSTIKEQTNTFLQVVNESNFTQASKTSGQDPILTQIQNTYLGQTFPINKNFIYKDTDVGTMRWCWKYQYNRECCHRWQTKHRGSLQYSVSTSGNNKRNKRSVGSRSVMMLE